MTATVWYPVPGVLPKGNPSNLYERIGSNYCVTILPSCVVSMSIISFTRVASQPACRPGCPARTSASSSGAHQGRRRKWAVRTSIAASRPSVRAYHVDTPPTLDGLVNEPIWTAMQPATGFVQQEPNNGEPSTEQTEVRIAFDDDNLYLGVICLDSQPDNIVVTQNRRDGSLENTDSVEILFDTFNDKQNGVIFGTSPTGIEYDAQVSKAGQGRGGAGSPARAGGAGTTNTSSTQRGGAAAVNINWDAVWTVRSQITARGWEAEFKIPLRTLRYNPGDDVAWGLNIKRNLRRHNEQSFWSPLSRAYTITQVEMAGQLEHLSLKPHRNLKLLPYVLGRGKAGFHPPHRSHGSATHGRARPEIRSNQQPDAGRHV